MHISKLQDSQGTFTVLRQWYVGGVNYTACSMEGTSRGPWVQWAGRSDGSTPVLYRGTECDGGTS